MITLNRNNVNLRDNVKGLLSQNNGLKPMAAGLIKRKVIMLSDSAKATSQAADKTISRPPAVTKSMAR